MGKTQQGSSLLSTFKRVFRINKTKEEKNRGKQKWVFRQTSNHESVIHCEARTISVFVEAARESPAAIVDDGLRDHFAAIVIQKAFKGYLARKALLALKGVVKLQALIRGCIVRNRAEMTLQCVQSLIRVQNQVLDQRRRLSFEGNRNSTLLGSNFADRQSFIWRNGQERVNEELVIMPPWEIRGRASCDQINSIKGLDMNSSPPYSFSAPNSHKFHNPNLRFAQQNQILCSYSVSSPKNRAYQNITLHPPIRPPPLKTKHRQVNSFSPRCIRGEQNNQTVPTPSYMAATASSMARLQCAPRHMISTPEREIIVSAKKRLSFPLLEIPYNGGSCHADKISPRLATELRR